MKNTSIILLGIKHSGKSTQGRLLAEHRNCPFIDIDDVITETTGKSPREIYTEHGADAFMKAEEDACRKVGAKYKETAAVIATGGGICDNAPALEELRSIGCFVFINVPEKLAAGRILKKAEQHSDGSWSGLPAYIAKKNPESQEQIRKIFHSFYEERTAVYKRIADITVDTGDRTKQENARYISDALDV